MCDHEAGKHERYTRIECGDSSHSIRSGEIKHPKSGKRVVQDDNELQPVEMESALMNEEGEQCARKIKNGSLDVCEERHSVEGVRIPERELPGCH
jgi:hypothetical protein